MSCEHEQSYGQYKDDNQEAAEALRLTEKGCPSKTERSDDKAHKESKSRILRHCQGCMGDPKDRDHGQAKGGDISSGSISAGQRPGNRHARTKDQEEQSRTFPTIDEKRTIRP